LLPGKDGVKISCRLSETEREYFRRRRERFELNAILPDSLRIEYIERKLDENGVRGKVIPPEGELPDLADEIYREQHATWVDEALQDLVSLEEIKRVLADRFVDEFGLEHAKRYIEEGFKKDRTLSWRDTLSEKLSTIQEEHVDGLQEVVRERFIEAMK
jgi:hypothetical protein